MEDLACAEPLRRAGLSAAVETCCFSYPRRHSRRRV